MRLLPALNITPEQVDEGCEILGGVLREMANGDWPPAAFVAFRFAKERSFASERQH